MLTGRKQAGDRQLPGRLSSARAHACPPRAPLRHRRPQVQLRDVVSVGAGQGPRDKHAPAARLVLHLGWARRRAALQAAADVGGRERRLTSHHLRDVARAGVNHNLHTFVQRRHREAAAGGRRGGKQKCMGEPHATLGGIWKEGDPHVEVWRLSPMARTCCCSWCSNPCVLLASLRGPPSV